MRLLEINSRRDPRFPRERYVGKDLAKIDVCQDQAG